MGSRTRRGLCVLAIAACLSPSPSAAGLFQDTAQNPLASVTGLRCRFSLTTSVLWKDGKPDVRSQATESRLTIANIDVQDGTAEIPGPRGRGYATTTLSDGSLFVMESARGALRVTTVFAVESSPGLAQGRARGILVRVSHRPAIRAGPDGDPELRGVSARVGER